MLLHNARKHRLMREALGNDEGRLPSAALTIRTLGVVTLCFGVVVISASGWREPPAMVASSAAAQPVPAREAPHRPAPESAKEEPVETLPVAAKNDR